MENKEYRLNFVDLDKSLIRELIIDEIPFVYIENHCPLKRLDWWKTSVPIDQKQSNATFCIRNLSYDIMLSTKEFLEYCEILTNDGFSIYQLNRELPNTFLPSNVKGDFLSIAKEVGIVTCIEQPSQNDIVHFWTLSQKIYNKIGFFLVPITI